MITLNWKIAGAAGEGIKVAGLMLSKVALRAGFFVNGYSEYPSLIRGGHNTYQALLSSVNSPAPQIKLDVLIALNPEGITAHETELNKETIVLANTDIYPSPRALHLPMTGITKNTIALGASCYLLNLDLSLLNQVLAETFERKGEEIVKQNQEAAELGFNYAKEHYPDKKLPVLTVANTKEQIFLSGNEALALGAVAGGLKFYAAYPMTPSTALLHYLAKNEDRFNLVVRHAEDEIGVINMALGASFAGVKSMVGTAGGGFSLMTEGLGLAGVSETSIVIVLGMRPGPATGMPTWTGQGDLLFAINASQDEFPRIVLTPGDKTEAFEAGRLAQIWAEKYQLPVIILTDKHLAEDYATTDQLAAIHQPKPQTLADTSKRDNLEPFARYTDTPSGVSPRSLPGQIGGVHLTNSYEHDILGYAAEDSASRVTQVNKRFRKLDSAMADTERFKPVLIGPVKARITLVSWGSTKTTIEQALRQLPDVNLIHLPWVWPFPAAELTPLLSEAERLITVEGNKLGQLNRLIREQTGVLIKDQLTKYDGRPFYPEEIIAYVTNH